MVASAYAYNNLAPWRIMPPCSCSTPGKYPPVSTNVSSGILNAFKNRINRAALSLASQSKAPPRWAGLLATTPTTRPPKRMKPMTTFLAKFWWISKKPKSSANRQMTWWIRNAFLGSISQIRSSTGTLRSARSLVVSNGGFSSQFCGKKESNSRTWRKQSCSDLATNWHTPLFSLCGRLPPKESKSTSSPVAAFTAPGPVINI